MIGNLQQYRQPDNLGDIRLGPLRVDGAAETAVAKWIHEHPYLTIGAVVFAIWWIGRR